MSQELQASDGNGSLYYIQRSTLYRWREPSPIAMYTNGNGSLPTVSVSIAAKDTVALLPYSQKNEISDLRNQICADVVFLTHRRRSSEISDLLPLSDKGSESIVANLRGVWL